jgi:hypothetical protein
MALFARVLGRGYGRVLGIGLDVPHAHSLVFIMGSGDL